MYTRILAIVVAAITGFLLFPTTAFLQQEDPIIESPTTEPTVQGAAPTAPEVKISSLIGANQEVTNPTTYTLDADQISPSMPAYYGPYDLINAINRYCHTDSGPEVCFDIGHPWVISPPAVDGCGKYRVTLNTGHSFDGQVTLYGYFNGPSESTEDLRVIVNGVAHDWHETNTESQGWHRITVPSAFHFNTGANDIWFTSPYYPKLGRTCKSYGSIRLAAGCPSIHGWYSAGGYPKITPPSPPNHSSPANNQVYPCKPSSVVLRWACQDNESQAQLARDSGFTSIVGASNWLATGEGQSGNWDVTSLLTTPGTYWWRVHARNDGGEGSWSSPWQFTLANSPPSQPSLVSPANNTWVTSRTLTLQWNTCTDDGCPGTGISYEPAIIDGQSTSTSNTNWNVTFPADGDFDWHVRALDGNAYGNWSDTWKVRIDTERPTAQITSGPSGQIIAHDVTFAWTGSDGRTPLSNLQFSYRLVGFDNNWSSWSKETTKTWAGLPEAAYRYELKALDEAGNESSQTVARVFAVGSQNLTPTPTPTLQRHYMPLISHTLP